MSTSLETELKLRADEAALRHLASLPALGPGALGPPRRVTELDIYVDTPDGRLAAAGWACRLRSRGDRRSISLKGPARHTAGDPLHRRTEIEADAPEGDISWPAAWPASAARDLVLRLAGDAPLAEQLTLRQDRTERELSLAGSAVGTLSLDRVRVEVDGSSPGGFSVVELEAAADVETDRLSEVFDALRAVPGLEPDPLSKLERALRFGRRAAGAGP